MCGIVGFISGEAPNVNDKHKFMEQALIIDTLRGDDGTGVFCVRRDDAHYSTNSKEKHIEWFKTLDDGYGFVNRAEYDTYLGINPIRNYKYAVGHNRAATFGGIELGATHPFQEGPITLVHNGTLTRTTDLPITQGQAGAFNDSHTIAHNLANHDAKEVLEKLEGAYALVWHDSRDDSLNIVRNSRRPLYMSRVGRDNTIFFASEGEMLYLLDSRIKLGLQEIVQPKPGYWLKFTEENLMKPHVKKITPNTTSYSHNSTGYRGGNTRRDHDKAHGSASSWFRRQSKKYLPSNTLEDTRTPLTSTTVKVGNQRKAIPDILQEEIFKYDLLIEDILAFAPEDALTQAGKATITGYVLGDRPGHKVNGLDAMVYDVQPHLWETARTRMWTIRPLGVKNRGDGTPILIAKLVNTMDPHGDATTPPKREEILEFLTSAKPWTGEEDNNKGDLYGGTEGAPNMVLGPHGTLITISRYNQLVRNGCVMCGTNLDEDDCYEIEWVNDNGMDPLCRLCQQDARLFTNDKRGKKNAS